MTELFKCPGAIHSPTSQLHPPRAIARVVATADQGLCSILPGSTKVCCSHIPHGTVLKPWIDEPPAPGAPVLQSAWFDRYLAGDKQARKEAPLARGLFGYFPNACLQVAHVAFVANEQHNPGLPLQWAFDKSSDEPDCELRHMLDSLGAAPFDDDGLMHKAKKAWRAMADLERDILKRYPKATPGASVTGLPKVDK